MMSYPNYGGEDKSLHHPDVLSLARAAERAGADVRVVLLMRDALGTVVSDTVHMHYGGKGGASGGSEREERILIDNAAALLAQTMLVDRRFVACADYDDRSLAWAGAVADALMWPGLPDVLRNETKPVSKTKKPPAAELAADHVVFAQPLVAIVEATRGFCPPAGASSA